MDVSIEDRLALYDLLVRYTTNLGPWKPKSRLVRIDIILSADRWAS